MAAPSKQPQAHDRGSNSVRVEIFDQGYNLSGPDPQYILRLAEYVDEVKLVSLTKGNPSQGKLDPEAISDGSMARFVIEIQYKQRPIK